MVKSTPLNFSILSLLQKKKPRICNTFPVGKIYLYIWFIQLMIQKNPQMLLVLGMHCAPLNLQANWQPIILEHPDPAIPAGCYND